jgi:hypothetical protein
MIIGLCAVGKDSLVDWWLFPMTGPVCDGGIREKKMKGGCDNDTPQKDKNKHKYAKIPDYTTQLFPSELEGRVSLMELLLLLIRLLQKYSKRQSQRHAICK